MTWLVLQRSVWNDIVSWRIRRLSNSAKYLLHASMTTTSKKKKQNLLEICHKYALKLFWNACTWHGLEDLIFYGKIDHKMNRSLWQTIMSFHLLHSSYMWIETVLPCGKHCKAMQIWTVSGLWLCGRSWRFKIHFRRNIMCIWKQNICSCKLDVQETNISIPQFYRIWNHFVGCWIANGRITCSRPLGRGTWSVTFDKQHCKTRWTSSRKLVRDRRPFHQ